MRTILLLAVMALGACGAVTSGGDVATTSDAASDTTAPMREPDVAMHDEPVVTMEDATVITTQDATVAVDGDASPLRNPACPTAPPVAGSPCTPILSCAYGSDVHHVCLTRADCASSNGTNFQWFVSAPPDGCGTNAASCPVSFTALAEGSPCPGVTSFCDYPEGRCGCESCSGEGGMSKMWACRKWGSSDEGCPYVPPLTGDACATPNQLCSYGGFCRISVGATMICENGFWKAGGIAGSCAIPVCGAP